MRLTKSGLPVLILVGPTGIGKTDLSIHLAERFNGEIVSVDSMQVYRYMDIGTAKVGRSERERIPHHLIDIVDPDQEYNAAQFARDCRKAVADIHSRNALPILAGGSGLYLKAFREGLFPGCQRNDALRIKLLARQKKCGNQHLHNILRRLDPLSAERLHANDSYRVIRALEVVLDTGVPFSVHLDQQVMVSSQNNYSNILSIGLTCSREQLYKRINQRSKAMLAEGLAEEVQSLLDKGYTAELKSMQSIGYRHMVNFLSGVWSRTEMFELLARDTRRYAKRQFTWFNKDKTIAWWERSEHKDISRFVADWLNEIN